MMEDADYALALSIAQAVETDAPLIAALLQEDEQAERDRNFALRLEQDPGVRSASPARENGARSRRLDNESFATLRLFNIPPPATDAVLPAAYSVLTVVDDTDTVRDDAEGNDIQDNIDDRRDLADPGRNLDRNIDHDMYQDDGPGEEPERELESVEFAEYLDQMRSRLALLTLTSSPVVQPPETTECTSCSDKLPVSGIFEAPCSHKFCRTCLANWIQTSMRDESSFPLKCCGQIIPIALDNPLISKEQFEEYEAWKVELETPDRTYCSDAACAAFIPPRSIQGDIASCIRCGRETCVKCKSERHPDLCSGLQDHETREVLAMAEAEGWRQCGQCHHIVSLSRGCNHITCRCGYQFCYRCGERWKTCGCPYFQIENLLHGQAEDEALLAEINARLTEAFARLTEQNARLTEHLAPLQRPVRIGGQAGRKIPCRHEDVRMGYAGNQCDRCHLALAPYFIRHCQDCGLNLCGICRSREQTR